MSNTTIGKNHSDHIKNRRVRSGFNDLMYNKYTIEEFEVSWKELVANKLSVKQQKWQVKKCKRKEFYGLQPTCMSILSGASEARSAVTV